MPIVQFARAIQAASTQRCSRRPSARRGSPSCGSTPHRCHIAVDGPTAIGPSCWWRPSAWACLVRLEMAMFAPPVSAYRLSAFFSRDCFSADGLPNEISFEVRPAKCVPALFCSFTPGRLGRVADEGHCALVWAACRRILRSRAQVLADLNAIHSRPMLQCNMIIVQCNHTRGMT
jgi:hypothetical protein